MRIAIVHHWLVSQGGGERVLESLALMFPEADIFTLVASAAGTPNSLQGRKITQSFLGQLPFSSRIYKHLLPLYPLAVEQLDLREYDLVISSDAGPMKGVIVAPGAVHICYCHSPMRYVWNQYRDYSSGLPHLARCAFSLSAHYIRNWDYSAAQRVTHFLANSNNVAARIQQYYARESTVLYPPIDTSKGHLAEEVQDHYLTVGRLVPYKRIDLIITACNRLGRKLRVIGSGPEEHRLRAIAGRTIEFVGEVDSTALWREYARCRALLFAAEEDFGMVAVEAQACGRPVIAYGKGGALESVVQSGSYMNGSATGVFFSGQSVYALSNAIIDFESREWQFHPYAIQEWAQRFDSTHFETKFRKFVSYAMEGRFYRECRETRRGEPSMSKQCDQDRKALIPRQGHI